MNLVVTLSILILVYLATSARSVAEAKTTWRARSNSAKFAKAGTLAAIKTLRSFLQVAIVTLGTALLATFLLIRISPYLGASALEFLRTITARAKLWTDSLSLGLTVLGFVLGLSGLFWIAWRARSGKLRKTLEGEHKRQMRELLARAQAGELEAIPPSAQMVSIGTLLAQIDARIARSGTRPDLVAQRTALESAYQFMDLDRRIDLNEMPIVDETLQGFWPRLGLFVVSAGVDDLRASSAKLLGRIGTAATCIATIGVSTPVIVSGALAPLIASVFDLELAEKAGAVRSELAAMANAPVPPSAPSPVSSTSIYRPIAHEFARRVAASLSGYMDASRATASSSDPSGGASDLDELALREAVLSEYAASFTGPANERPVSLATNLDGGSDRAHQRFAVFRQDLTSEGGDGSLPSTPTNSARAGEHRVAHWLRWVATRSPPMNAKIAAFTASTTKPRPMSSFQEAVLGEFISQILEKALPEPDALGAFAGKQVGKTARKGLEAGVADYTLAAFNGFLRDLAGPATVQQALSRIGRGPPGTLRFTDDERTALANYFADLQRDRTDLASASHDEPTLAAAPGDAAKTLKISRSLSPDAGAASAEEVAGGYSDLFPGSAADAGQTALALASRNTRTDPADAVQTARDFTRLSKDSHVGGVVIGKDATGQGDFIDLRWTRQDGRFALWLVGRGGRSTKLGSFDGAILQQAIAYAADGRQTAVTIVNAATFSGVQKIHLHPALQNTALGCWLMDLDSMIFDETGADPKWQEWSDRVEQQAKLYQVGAAMLHDTPVREPPKKPALTALFPPGWTAADRNVSVFASEPDVYSLTLAQSLANCRVTGGSYWTCVGNDYAGKVYSMSEAQAEHEKRVLIDYSGSTAPAMLSGVRELEYRPAVSAFTSSPNYRAFLHFAYLAVVPGTAGNDNLPWEFPMLGDQAERMVERLTATHPERASVLARTLEFTVAQRLARAGLHGALGPAFPRTRFLDLLREAKAIAPVKYVTTPVWTVMRLQDLRAGRTAEAAAVSPETAFAQAQGNLGYLTTPFEKQRSGWLQFVRKNTSRLGDARAAACMNALKTSQLSNFDGADVAKQCKLDPSAFKPMVQMTAASRFLSALLANAERSRFTAGARCPATRPAS